MEERRFSGAVGSDQGVSFARLHAEIDAPDDLALPKTLPEAGQLDDVVGHRACSSASAAVGAVSRPVRDITRNARPAPTPIARAGTSQVDTAMGSHLRPYRGTGGQAFVRPTIAEYC